jgi:pyridoxamine 5'-phosphate oxidase-like protein
MAPARSPEERKRDVLALLGQEVDVWVASASADGEAMLVPLSFVWDGRRLTVSTPLASRTARNLIRAGVARVALGATRDVVLIDGTLEVITLGAEPDLEEAHARATEFDPRTLADEYVYLRLTPQRIQAWREVNELRGRHVMRDGAWVV